jgi:tetratricopeptide (TPR) repeat protein
LGVAQTSAQTSAQTGKRDAAELIKSGNAKYAHAEYESAIAVYARVSPVAGEEYAQALYNQGVCYYELWRTAEAVAMYRKALAARGGRYPRATYALGVALEDLQRPAEASAAYRAAIASAGETGETYAPAYFRLGLTAAQQDDFAGAVLLFRQALSGSRAAFPSAHNNLGVALARTGRLHEAEREFATAIRQDRGEGRARFPEAQQNLELCRSLLKAEADARVASLMLVAGALLQK